MNSYVRVSDFMSRNENSDKIMKNKSGGIFAYPQNDVREVAKIMSDIKIDYMPVLFSPWNKKLVGFIELRKIRVLLND